jgi:hypothetical protein
MLNWRLLLNEIEKLTFLCLNDVILSLVYVLEQNVTSYGIKY